MPKLLEDIAERRADRARARARSRARRAASARARRRVVLKAAGCVAVAGTFLLLALAVGDSNYHATAIGWVPLLAMAAAIVAAFAYLQVLKRSLRFSDAAAEAECERDSEVRFAAHFENPSPLFFFGIEADVYVSDSFGNVATESTATLSLAPFEEADLPFTARFDHVGTYSAGLLRVRVKDFLGLFTATIENETRREVHVTPKEVRLSMMRFSNDAIVESMRAQRSVLADSMDYAHVREYSPGDPLKAIHWKLSAKGGQYMTRLYEVQTNPGVAVLLDFYAPGDDALVLMGLFDAVVESGFAIAQYAREQGMEAEIVFRDRNRSLRRIDSWSRSSLSRVIADMPHMSPDAAEEAACIDLVESEAAGARGQGNIVVCSASMSPSLLSSLADAKLRRRSPYLVCAIPSNVLERERDAYCKPLERLDAADVPYVVLSDSRELEGAVL